MPKVNDQISKHQDSVCNVCVTEEEDKEHDGEFLCVSLVMYIFNWYTNGQRPELGVLNVYG